MQEPVNSISFVLFLRQLVYMITKLSIENFRSIQDAELPLAGLNVFTGANNSGKSSVIYALAAYQSFMDNPNRTLDQILALPFINIGTFKEIVFDKKDSNKVSVKVDFKVGDSNIGPFTGSQNIVLHPSGSSVQFSSYSPEPFDASIDIGLPTTLAKEERLELNYQGISVPIDWNGFRPVLRSSGLSQQITARFIWPLLQPKIISDLLSFVPIERGFKQPAYNVVSINPYRVYTEFEIATVIERNPDLANSISGYLDKIVGRTLQIDKIPDTYSFQLQTLDTTTGFVTDLVNEGSGTNQLVTVLAKILHPFPLGTVCIDEPEIHLHPSAIDKFIDVIIEIIRTPTGKQFIISTHSEHLVQSLLSKLREGKLKPNNVNIYYARKNGKLTEFELQPINKKGQIEGGLKSFYEEELKNMKDFFKVD